LGVRAGPSADSPREDHSERDWAPPSYTDRETTMGSGGGGDGCGVLAEGNIPNEIGRNKWGNNAATCLVPRTWDVGIGGCGRHRRGVREVGGIRRRRGDR